MKARFKYRIDPNSNQRIQLAKQFGCNRVVWNDALAIYKKEGIHTKDVDKRVITQAKKTEERHWLSEVSNIPLQQSFRDLKQAYSNFFNSLKGKRKGKKVGEPKFKSKHSRQTARYRIGGFSVHSESVKLAKIGHIKMVVTRQLPSESTSVTITRDTTNRYFASFVVEIEPEIFAATNSSVGIDLGLSHFAILSNGEKIENPRLHKKMLKRIKKANKKLSRCKKDSNRRKRAKLKLAKLHAKIKDSRTDFLHKLTTRLVSENQAIAIEDLAVGNLIKNCKLSRAISDAGWYSFRQLLIAKCDKYNRQLVVIDRWEATSQKCSNCGFNGGKKKLNVREWTCLNCGVHHDRDICAAINIKVAGGLSETKNGRGRDNKTTLVANLCEPSTTYKQLSLF
ncbi:transposase [Hyella patelloides LEGE 07179]|uniref:Transposase n=1 Tax=Hyella patelloides LEGE 07179 TaxID=945734 RepID=A0A563W466_9CYAN|nr:RNA-guided endonuclease TnpB family protein [Hyella patelloides]VEP18492.1 transposase [Hyella patelloides LEGE 07179]